MGLIHSRAAKKRNRAQAQLAREQAKLVRAERAGVQQEVSHAQYSARVAAAGGSPWRQPTIRDAIAAWRGRKVS